MTKTIRNVQHNDEYETITGLYRVDFTGRRVGSVKKTDEGYLAGQAPIAKVGILTYYLEDGTTRRELVSKDTLFNADSMRSLYMRPITDTHPREKVLDSGNVKRRKVGFTGETVKQDGEFLTVSVIITDADAITNVQGGRQELSPGYRCDVLMEPGEFEGHRYDGIQQTRRYNHIAICDRARGGKDLKLHLDSVEHLDGFEVQDSMFFMESGFENMFNEDELKTLKILLNKGKGGAMPQINVDGISYEAAQEVINALSKSTTRADAAEGKVDAAEAKATDLQTKLDTAEGERDGLKTKVDGLEKLDHLDAINDGVTERIAVLDTVDAVIPEDKRKELKVDEMSNKELKVAVIMAKSPDAKLDEKSDDYINARFDSISEALDFDPNAAGNARKKSVHRSDSSNVDEGEKARLDSEERMKNAHKTLGGTVKAQE